MTNEAIVYTKEEFDNLDPLKYVERDVKSHFGGGAEISQVIVIIKS